MLGREDRRAFEVAVLAGLSARSSTCLQVRVREKRVSASSSARRPWSARVSWVKGIDEVKRPIGEGRTPEVVRRTNVTSATSRELSSSCFEAWKNKRCLDGRYKLEAMKRWGQQENERKDITTEQHALPQAFLLLAVCSPAFSRARFHSAPILAKETACPKSTGRGLVVRVTSLVGGWIEPA